MKYISNPYHSSIYQNIVVSNFRKFNIYKQNNSDSYKLIDNCNLIIWIFKNDKNESSAESSYFKEMYKINARNLTILRNIMLNFIELESDLISFENYHYKATMLRTIQKLPIIPQQYKNLLFHYLSDKSIAFHFEFLHLNYFIYAKSYTSQSFHNLKENFYHKIIPVIKYSTNLKYVWCSIMKRNVLINLANLRNLRQLQNL